MKLKVLLLIAFFISAMYVVFLGLILMTASAMSGFNMFALYNLLSVTFALMSMIFCKREIQRLQGKRKTDKEKKYRCDRCGRSFPTSSGLDGHRSHCK